MPLASHQGRIRRRAIAVTGKDQGSLAAPNADVLAEYGSAMVQERRPVTASARQPAPGEHARGYGVSGRIAAVPERQPLAADGIWRVTLAGESFGRLVRQDTRDGSSAVAGWQLLQLDDIPEAQLDAYEAAMREVG